MPETGGQSRAPAVLPAGPTPKHAQLREILRTLAAQRLLPGAALPSERSLAARYEVSRLTVREAVGQLVAEGVLVRIRGKGTFAARPRVNAGPLLSSFTAQMRRNGLSPETVVLDWTETTPPATTAETLGLALDQPAYWISRLRKADGAPMAVDSGWYHPELVPGLLREDLTSSLYALFTHTYGVPPEHGTQTAFAEAADAETARLLDMRPGRPVLVFRRVTAARGRPVEDVTSWYRGDSYQVTMHLDRDPDDPGHDRYPGGTR